MSVMQPVARALGEMVAPLFLALEDEKTLTLFLQSLGWEVSLSQSEFAIVQDLLPRADDLNTLLELATGFDDDAPASMIEDAIRLADDIFDAISALSSITPQQIQGLAAPLNTTAFWASLALDIPEYLVVTYLEGALPAVYALLLFGGIIETEITDDEPPRTISHLNWSQLAELLRDPTGTIASLYQWGGTFDHYAFLERLALLALSLGIAIERVSPPLPVLDQFYPDAAAPFDLRQLRLLLLNGVDGQPAVQAGVMLLPVPAPGETVPAGLYAGNVLWGNLSGVDMGPVQVEGSADASGAVGLRLQPGQPPQFEGTAPDMDFAVKLNAAPDDPYILFGKADGARVQFAGYEVEMRMQGSVSQPEFILRAATTGDGLQVIIAPGEGDSFIRELLGDNALTAGTDIDLTWSSRTGFHIAGGAALDITIPLNLKILVVTLLELHLSLGIGADGMIEAQADVDASALLGPFTLTVANVGMQATLVPGDDPTASGTFGGLDIQWAFKPPSGAGVAFDFLGMVYGGGFIDHDPDIGQYSGMIVVEILSIGVTATAIITTRPPDNPDGWSLFVSINVDLGGIPLGFGFTLEKIGGLVGIHRTIDTAALQTGLRTGILDSVLFPNDAIANASRILSDIETAFPTAQGSFVVGAMLQIGWGTPTIITASLGLIIQVPDIIIVLIGQAETILPFDDEPLIEIHFDVLGVLDLTAGTLAIDAGLRDSQIVGFVLTGQMALRASFLTEPSFLLSMGGFHPAFTPPDNFPRLDRMGFGLSVGSWLNISLEAYLALTSNTVQFGAGLYLTAALVGFRIEGGTELNTLIQFKPFQFRADLSYYITVSAASVELMGVLLTGSVSGPNPYFVRGQAEFKLLGLKKSVDIEATIGHKSAIDDADDVPVLPDVVAAFADPESWRAVDEGVRIGAVLLASVDDAAAPVAVHPGGRVEVVQRVAPLDVRLEHYGNAGIEGQDTLSISAVEAGGSGIAWEFVEDWFAPAQFFDLQGSEKLQAPSFEKMKGGLRLGDDEAEDGPRADTVFNYKQIIHDPEFEVAGLRPDAAYWPQSTTLSSLQAQVVTRDSTRRLQPAARQCFTLNPTRYVIVVRDSLTTPATMPAQFMTYAEARQMMRQHKDGRAAEQIVITSSERQPQ